MGKRISILTRGSHDFGMGHLHRSLWMREVLLGSGRELELQICCLPGKEAEEYFAGLGAAVSFGNWLDQPGDLPDADLLLVDWLDSDPAFLESIRPYFPRIALLDDYGPATGLADLVIRCLLSDIATAHGKIGRAEVMSGIRYLQLSLSVLKLRFGATASRRAMAEDLRDALPAEPGPVHGIMLSFGGTPRPQQLQFTLSVLAELQFPGHVIVKPAPKDIEVPAGLDVQLDYGTAGFHKLLSACDMCIIGGGLTLYEAIFLGVPPVVLPVVEHQQLTAGKLSAAGCCWLGSRFGELDHNLLAGRLMELINSPGQRGHLISNGMRLVDGMGIYRTMDALLELLDRGSAAG